MDRESFDVSVSTAGDGRPVLAIDFSNSSADITERLAAPDDGQMPATDVDVTFRETEGAMPGVLALANRLTGEFVLETGLESDRLFALVDAVLDADEERAEYLLRLTDEDGRSVTYEKETLLVYDEAGNLRRGRSLIPGGVEL